MSIVKATQKGQVVIPAAIRKKYHITRGTKVMIHDRNGEIVLKPLFKDPVREVRGILKEGPSALKALLEDRKEESAK